MAYYAILVLEMMMVTRNVVLTEHMSQLVDGLVASGRFQNASEAMRAGLRLLEKEETEWAEVRRGVLEGLEQVRRGEFAKGTGADAMRQAFTKGRNRK